MAEDVVKFELDGPITLHGLSTALSRFEELAAAIAEEVAPDQSFEWVIEYLEAGSAITEFRTKTDRPEYGAEVRLGITTSLDAARSNRVIPFRQRVTAAARSVIALVGSEAEALRCNTEYGQVEVDAPILLHAPRQTAVTRSFGMIKGEVDGLIRSKGRFVVLTDSEVRPVNCYLAKDVDVDQVMPGLYGKRVRVSGDLERDRRTGRVLRVEEVEPRSIQIISRPDPQAFEAALGVYQMPKNYPLPEQRRAAWDD